jgi:hypothetical protein
MTAATGSQVVTSYDGAMALVHKARAGLALGGAHLSALGPRVKRRSWRFEADGRSYPYLVHHFNTTWRNERCVEIPIAGALLDATDGGRVLEVGHVTHWYRRHHHEVVDKYEVAPGVLNLDVVDIEPGPRYDAIIAISTLEHVGFDEEVKDFAKPRVAVEHLRSLLVPGGTMLVSIPVGQNPGADDLFHGSPAFDTMFALRRVSLDGRWEQTPVEAVRGVQYGTPYPCANAVAFGISRA